jgi:hypothetical protein
MSKKRLAGTLALPDRQKEKLCKIKDSGDQGISIKIVAGTSPNARRLGNLRYMVALTGSRLPIGG